ncbi:MAG: four-carbon acid sugar kinase family protein [Burkholderiaceae bacterium]
MNEQLLLSYYGDDLTGSTDVMESLSLYGLPNVLFLRQPDSAQLARFDHCRAVGLAGTSRSQTPAWMEQHLPSALEWLRALDAAICHYKVCSTFDSAPHVGSIGKALDIGHDLFGQAVTPVVVGAPQLRRYTAFGHLFAAVHGVVHRIDRHPVMSRHPVTPMLESDLRRHLGLQTRKSIALADFTVLKSADTDEQIDRLIAGGAEALLLDVLDHPSQCEVGRQLWRTRGEHGRFVVGSSGLEYALLQEWTRLGMIPGRVSYPDAGPVDRIAVVSGSCSEVTAGQIAWAETNGFAALPLDARELGQADTCEAAIGVATNSGIGALRGGRSVVFFSARGPDNLVAHAEADPDFRHRIGRSLGRILRNLIQAERLSRVVVAGGDTSSHALAELDIHALTIRMPLAETPGSPLCLAHSDTPAFNGLEIALKGGQIGSRAYFGAIRDGRG